jgi:hypothetical protein
MNYHQFLRNQQARFRKSSPTVSEAGRRPTDRIGQRHGHLVALGHEEENLYPALRGPGGAIDFFRTRQIKWWQDRESGDAIDLNGPTRNLTSSQLACVNFLLPLAQISGALEAALRVVDEKIESVIPLSYDGFNSTIEFEWTGLSGSLEQIANSTRGCGVTSGDALVVANTRSHRRGYLIEWKLAESYERTECKGDGAKGGERKRRYAHLYRAADSSFNEIASLEDWLYEPLYQLMRLRLLADRMVRSNEFGVQEVELVVVCPPGNTAYLNNITSGAMSSRLPNARNLADVMRDTLRYPERVVIVSPHDLLAGVRAEGLGSSIDCWCSYHNDRYGW